jgi:hypothetical protein
MGMAGLPCMSDAMRDTQAAQRICEGIHGRQVSDIRRSATALPLRAPDR